MSLAGTSSNQFTSKAPTKSKSSGIRDEYIQPLYQCSQCQSQVSELHLYMYVCMHSVCRDCLVKVSTNPCTCFCGKNTDRSLLLNVNRVRTSFGKCQGKRDCANLGSSFCSKCRMKVCERCVEEHVHLQHLITAVDNLYIPCSKHPLMVAKFLCNCGEYVCHSCSTGYNKEHRTHTKVTRLDSAFIIDSMEQMHKSATELQKTTKGSFQHFTKEKEKMREHFKKMKLELTEKTIEIVNMLMRKVNDCVIAMEMFEKSYMDSYDNCERDHRKKQNSILLFKKLSLLTADNFPSQENLPFMREASVQLSADSSDIATRMNECVDMYRTAPTLLIDMKAINDCFHAHTRFLFKNQSVAPPIKTDSGKKLINVDMEKIQRAIFDDSITLKKRVFNPGGPQSEGPDPKRVKIDNVQGFIPTSSSTTITNFHKTNDRTTFSIRGGGQLYPGKNYSNAAINQFASNARPHVPTIDPRNMPNRTAQPRMFLQNMNPVRPMRPNPNSSLNISSKNHPLAPAPTNSNNGPRFSVPRPPIRLTNNINGNGTLNSNRSPIVCDLRHNSELDKQLMDVLKGRPSLPPHPGTSHHNFSRMPVIQPRNMDQIHVANQASAPQTPTLDNGCSSSNVPSLPPIKLTLKRNNIQPRSSTDNGADLQKVDDWDDYCFVCNQGCDEISGELVCCETCPKVYHNLCHCPRIAGDVRNLPDDWRCSRCQRAEPVTALTDCFTAVERLVCAKVLLKCYEKTEHVEPFHNPIPITTKRYFEIIKQPMCLREIGHKISTFKYQNIGQFIEDMNLVFKNCSMFNKKGTSVEESNKFVYGQYQQAVVSLLPVYVPKIWMYVNLHKPY